MLPSLPHLLCNAGMIVLQQGCLAFLLNCCTRHCLQSSTPPSPSICRMSTCFNGIWYGHPVFLLSSVYDSKTSTYDIKTFTHSTNYTTKFTFIPRISPRILWFCREIHRKINNLITKFLSKFAI